MDTKQNILDTISDLVMDFLYYDRKDTDAENLQLGDIDDAVRDGKISVNQIVNKFRSELIEGLN